MYEFVSHGAMCEVPPSQNQIHAAGGVSGSITMVMVFVRSLIFFSFFSRDSSVGLILTTYNTF